MAEAVPIEKRKGVNLVERVTAFPRAWSGIVNFVRDQDIDMIVMNTHARKAVPSFFLGSVAEAVIEEAPCCEPHTRFAIGITMSPPRV
jgi:nucleotide-binding universal stress UspA family protein